MKQGRKYVVFDGLEAALCGADFSSSCTVYVKLFENFRVNLEIF
jgi:hypothetical protein